MKIRPVGAELFHTDGRADRNDVANSRFFFAILPLFGIEKQFIRRPTTVRIERFLISYLWVKKYKLSHLSHYCI